MNKQSIQRAFGKDRQFLTISDISRTMNLDRGTVRQLVKGLPYIPIGRKKLFLATDVAEVIWSRKV